MRLALAPGGLGHPLRGFAMLPRILLSSFAGACDQLPKISEIAKQPMAALPSCGQADHTDMQACAVA